MTIQPKISEDARHVVTRSADKLIARSRRGLKLRGERVQSDLLEIAADDLQSNYAGVRQTYLATLRLTTSMDVYEALLDDQLYVIANSNAVVELAQEVADEASDPAVIDGIGLQAMLEDIAKADLNAGILAVRGAFLAELEARLPHKSSEVFDSLLAGPLSFLFDSSDR